MNGAQVEILAIAVVTAAACALPGVFLVLRRMALISDAIGHSILLGIVLAFLVTGDLGSPLLVVGAAAVGVLTVALVEAVARTRLVAEDAAIGVVFPLLFSVGVILIAQKAGGVHLDTDAVLLGELAFAPFDRLVVNGVDLGPRALVVMGAILLANLALVALFYKELKLATFDAALAASLGFAPAVLHYGLMTVVSITTVGAFEAVGSILVVALMVGPPATAWLLTDRLAVLLPLAVGVGALSAAVGFGVATALDVSIAGSMAVAVGAVFGLALLLAPGRGVLAGARRRRRQRVDFAVDVLLIHLFQHEHLPEAGQENREAHLTEHVAWSPAFASRIVRLAAERGLVTRDEGRLRLTGNGRDGARTAAEFR